jgi:hypothetical protein
LAGAGYEASVFSVRDGKKIRKTFPTLAAAKAWRADALVGLRRGALRSAKRQTRSGSALNDGSLELLELGRSPIEPLPGVLRWLQ